jgi:hypothetical protein
MAHPDWGVLLTKTFAVILALGMSAATACGDSGDGPIRQSTPQQMAQGYKDGTWLIDGAASDPSASS